MMKGIMFKFTQILPTGTMRNICSTMRRCMLHDTGASRVKESSSHVQKTTLYQLHNSARRDCFSSLRYQPLLGLGDYPAQTEAAANVEAIVGGMSGEGESWTNDKRSREGYAPKRLYSPTNNTATNAGY